MRDRGQRGEERELLAKAAAGDIAAFEPVVNLHRDRAYRYALSLVRNHHDALDVSQEAFARAFRQLDRYDLDRPFLPWFLRILRNLCFNRLERDKRHPDHPGATQGDDILCTVPAAGESPTSEWERREQAQVIDRALSQLSPTHREILVMRHFEDMSYQQMTEALGVPPGTVMSRLYNARKKLAKLLKDADLA